MLTTLRLRGVRRRRHSSGALGDRPILRNEGLASEAIEADWLARVRGRTITLGCSPVPALLVRNALCARFYRIRAQAVQELVHATTRAHYRAPETK